MRNALETYLGECQIRVQAEISRLMKEDLVNRLCNQDCNLWNCPGMTDYLGWLTITDLMRKNLPDLNAIVQDIKGEHFSHVVLLGIGGSSLSGEVLHSAFNRSQGYPQFSVLDSTIPAVIRTTINTIDPASTLFLVSSKSGTTMETIYLYRLFRKIVGQVKKKDAGANFVAITDPDTPLFHLAKQDNYRKIFINPPTLGGRFSALSFFGLLPGALFGVDIEKLMDRADTMRLNCSTLVGTDNPGLYLGAVIGASARQGRDKLTLVCSPSLKGFEKWVEQLLAESTGKQGKGIIPIAGEPMVSPELYGQDRLFVYLRLDPDDNDIADRAVSRLKAYGHPVVKLAMRDKFDLGAQFFLWEFAVAVAGNVIGVNPFDQPDVSGSKDATAALLYGFIQKNKLPVPEITHLPADLFRRMVPGEYFSIMAFIPETERSNQIFRDMRQKILERYGVATALGYGPRFLHSTGQLHKGGPDGGVFLQITSSHENDIPVPGLPYTFGVVADAQAVGDLQSLKKLGRRVANQRIESYDALSAENVLDKLIGAVA